MVMKMFKEVISPNLPMGWLTKLIVGAAIAALFAWGGQWVGHVEGAVSKEQSLEVQQKEQHSAIDERIGVIYGSLDRIESKLDKIVEREITRNGGK